MRRLIVICIAALSLAAVPAYADRGYGQRGEYGRDSGHRGNDNHRGGGGTPWAGLAIVGAIAGLAIMAEQNNRPVYVEPAYAQPVYSQPVYPEPLPYNAAPAYSAPARAASDIWYYCPSSAMYYPYTKACPEGWEAVPARPY